MYQQLTAANKCLFSQFILKYYRDVSKHPLRDQLVLNFFSLQTICEEDVNTAELVLYVSYISALLRQGLSAENKF